MNSPFHRNWPLLLLTAVCIAVIAGALLAAPMPVAAQAPVAASVLPQGGVETAAPNAITADDGGAWELGVHGTAGNLTTATAAERYGMWVWLNGWFVRRYSFAESTAWEEDFKRAALGGTENFYIDSVDLQFYVGHGSAGRITFDNASHDDSTMQSPGDCNTTWGDNDNEWLAMTSCQVLSGTGLANMAQCMNRQHLILGFYTNASAHNNYWQTQAYHFGRYMRYGYNMTQAWFNACDVADRGRIVRAIAEETACFSDNPYYSSVCADVYDSDYYWYTHYCGTASASYVPVDLLQGEVPIFQVAPYSTGEINRDIGKLGNAFNITITPTVQAAWTSEGPGTPPDPQEGSPFLVSTDVSRTLELDASSGLFHYVDLGQQFTPQQAEAALAAQASSVNTIDNDIARRTADKFLNDFGLMQPDAVFDEVVQDMTGFIQDRNAGVTAADIEQAEVPVSLQVLYTRFLTESRVTAAGVTQEISYTVVGPGAKQKVALPMTGTVSAAGVLQADPLGVQGGWRGVQQPVSAATGEPLMAPIYTAGIAGDLYLTLGEKVAMNDIPLEIKSREILSSTLAYWEETAGSSQGELIPVYEFNVRFTISGTNETTDDFVYVPASPIYLRPYAEILDEPTVDVSPGVSLTLTAADASKTLAALGVGDDFNFVMGYAGAAGDYVYNWYLDSVAPENQLPDPSGFDTTITLAVPFADATHTRSLTIVLAVEDTSSPNQSIGTDVAVINVNPALFMPALSAPEQNP